VASDLSPAQVELGRARCEAEGVEVEWVESDSEQLPFEDDRFDCAASVFGAVFAPRPDRVAAELFRVVRPGGTVGLTSWGPYGSQGEMFALMERFAPPPPADLPSPRDWGREEIARERLEGLAASLTLERRTLHWEFASASEMWDTFGSAGPGAALRDMLDPDTLEQARDAAFELGRSHDLSRADDERIVLEPEYLEIVARKRG
jgi:SAM-dependent methyltransferase